MSNIKIYQDKIYEKLDLYIPRLTIATDYYSNKERMPKDHYVIVPLSKTPSYTIESVVLFSSIECKSIPIEKHFSKYHFSSPIQFIREYHEFCGISAFGYFSRKLYLVDENDMDTKIYYHKQTIPLTPRSITRVAKSLNKLYSDYLNIINKDNNVTIFNLSRGIELCFPEIDEIT